MYAVHELLEGDEDCSVLCEEEDLHVNEAVGKDLHPNEDGVWPDVLLQGNCKSGKGWGVDAGPIIHRGELSRS